MVTAKLQESVDLLGRKCNLPKMLANDHCNQALVASQVCSEMAAVT